MRNVTILAVKSISLVALVLLSFSLGCSSKTTQVSLKTSGSIELGGVTQEVVSCEMSGSSHGLTLSISLSKGASVILPIHESTVQLRVDKGSKPRTLACSKHEKSGSGSDEHYSGDISLSCGEGPTALVMVMNIQCGVAPPSNRGPKKQTQPS